MGRGDRTGNRKTREQRLKESAQVPRLGYYLIVTDTQGTERCFFDGLKEEIPHEMQSRLVIRVLQTKTNEMIDKCMEFMTSEAQYRIPWIVFDRDQVKDFDEIIRRAESKDIHVGWSNPCFEIWMYAYFGLMPTICQSSNCCAEFGKTYEKKTGQKYSKTNKHLYRKLCRGGNEENAIEIASQKYEQCIREGKTKPSEMCPCTKVHELVGEIRGKMKRNT